MPTSARGSERLARGCAHGCSDDGAAWRARGFTLIELLIVVAIVAVASAVATLALRDPQASALEQEADRLSALLEAARAESRASGLPLLWVPAKETAPGGSIGPRVGSDSGFTGWGNSTTNGNPSAAATNEQVSGFRFVGLPPRLGFPQHWLSPGVTAEVIGAPALVLGPEPLIGAQRVALRLGDRRLTLASDGLGPFLPVDEDLPGTESPRSGGRP